MIGDGDPVQKALQGHMPCLMRPFCGYGGRSSASQWRRWHTAVPNDFEQGQQSFHSAGVSRKTATKLRPVIKYKNQAPLPVLDFQMSG